MQESVGRTNRRSQGCRIRTEAREAVGFEQKLARLWDSAASDQTPFPALQGLSADEGCVFCKAPDGLVANRGLSVWTSPASWWSGPSKPPDYQSGLVV